MYDRSRERKLGIFAALARGVDSAAKNYQTSAINMQNLHASRYRLQKEKEGWETEKQTKELQLKKLENELDPANLALQREKLKQETNAKKAIYTLYESRSKLAESKAQQELEAAAKKKDLWEQIAQGVAIDPRIDVDFGAGLKYKAKSSSTGGFTEHQLRNQEISKNKVIAAIKNGKIPNAKSYSGFAPIKDAGDLEVYAMGEGVDLSDPDIQKTMRENGGEKMDFSKFLIGDVDAHGGKNAELEEEKMGSAAGTGAVPKWVPSEKRTKYLAAREHGYSDDDIKKKLKV